MYCQVNQESPNTSFNIPNKNCKAENVTSEVGNLSQNSQETNSGEVFALPDFQSTFGYATTNIIGCDWKSAQEYLTTDLRNDMPSWWHHGGEIKKGTILKYTTLRLHNSLTRREIN